LSSALWSTDCLTVFKDDRIRWDQECFMCILCAGIIVFACYLQIQCILCASQFSVLVDRLACWLVDIIFLTCVYWLYNYNSLLAVIIYRIITHLFQCLQLLSIYNYNSLVSLLAVRHSFCALFVDIVESWWCI